MITEPLTPNSRSCRQFSVQQLAANVSAQEVISNLTDKQLDDILHPWRGYTDASSKKEPLAVCTSSVVTSESPHSAPDQPVTYVLEKPSAENETQSLQNVVRKYGMYPTVGLLGAALASKELISVDVHTVLPQFTFLAIVTLGISAVLPDALKSAEETVIADRKYWNDFNQLQVELVRTSLDKLHASINTPDVLRAAKAEMNTITEAHYKYLNWQPRAQARKDVLAKLEAIQRTEQLKADEARASLLRDVMHKLSTRVQKLSNEERAKFTNMAIDALEGKDMSLFKMSNTHPVFKHSTEVLAEARKVYLAKLKQ